MLPVLIGLEGTEPHVEECAAIRCLQPAGFVLFARNIESIEQVRALTCRLHELCEHTPIIAIDQEGGRVTRTACLGLKLPSAAALAQVGDMRLLAQSAEITATCLRYSGVNMNLAPVLDIEYNKRVSNALAGRCWGTNEQQVISNAGVYAAQLQRGGIVSCGKHFPGMGHASVDPHSGLPVVSLSEQELFAGDMAPFLTLCPVLPAIMTAHIMLPELDSKLPATLSPKIVNTLLRDRLGFKGAVLTDDLCMGAIAAKYSLPTAALLAWRAGCDLPLICHHPLPHLDNIAEHWFALGSMEREDILHRTEQLGKQLQSPLRHDKRIWDQCCRKAEELCRRIACEEGEQDIPYSPVQEY